MCIALTPDDHLHLHFVDVLFGSIHGEITNTCNFAFNFSIAVITCCGRNVAIMIEQNFYFLYCTVQFVLYSTRQCTYHTHIQKLFTIKIGDFWAHYLILSWHNCRRRLLSNIICNTWSQYNYTYSHKIYRVFQTFFFTFLFISLSPSSSKA